MDEIFLETSIERNRGCIWAVERENCDGSGSFGVIVGTHTIARLHFIHRID